MQKEETTYDVRKRERNKQSPRRDFAIEYLAGLFFPSFFVYIFLPFLANLTQYTGFFLEPWNLFFTSIIGCFVSSQLYGLYRMKRLGDVGRFSPWLYFFLGSLLGLVFIYATPFMFGIV